MITNRCKRAPQPGEDTAKVVTDDREDGVGGVPSAAFQIAAAEVTLSLEVADHGLDGGVASQFALDGAKYAALLSRDEDAARVLGVMAAVPLVDIAALDLAAGDLLGADIPDPWCPGSRLGLFAASATECAEALNRTVKATRGR